MKSFSKISLIAFLIAFTLSCSKDRDSGSDSNNLTGLAAFLNGEFTVTRVDYNGSLNTAVTNIPLNGTGTGTQGAYIFDAVAKTVDYNVQSTMNVAIFNQSVDFPVNVAGAGTVEYVSETRFVITDPNYGTTTYDISNKTNTSLRATTRYETDTLGGTVDMLMDIYLEKK